MKRGAFFYFFDYESHYNMVGIFLVLILTAFSSPMLSQELVPVSTAGKGFDVNSGSQTELKFEVEGKSFDVFTTAAGSKYVKGISTTGSEYAIWIGEESNLKYDGKQARVFKSGSYAIFTLNSRGYPSPKWLKKKE